MDRIERIAAGLAEDWRTRAPYARLTGDDRPADVAEAYAIQRALRAHLARDRGALAGRKIALSSKAMQQMVGHSSPIAGVFFAGDLHQSPARIERAGFRGLGLEYELAMSLGRDVAPGDGPFDAASARAVIGEVRPAFELIEDRAADYADLCPLTITADNAWCGGVVLGEAIAGWEALDPGNLPAVLTEDGRAPETANTGAADPMSSFAWVLNHAGAEGETVRAGEWVITGSVLRTRFPKPGDRLRYEVGGRWGVEIEVV